MSEKEELHRLVDLLPDGEFPLAYRFLQFLIDDAEPLSDADRQAVREGEAAIARGDFTTLEDLKRELDL